MDNNIEYLNIKDIIPSKFKLREEDNDLDGLTISIQNYGVIQPILVRPNDSKYEIVLGQRRYEAALNVGLKQIPAIVKKLNDKEATEYIILDNIQRKNFTKEEIKIIYSNFKTKYNIDKYYISSNLGLKDNDTNKKEEENPNSNNQSNLLKDEQFKSIIDKTLNEPSITLKGKDIVNLDDLNKKETEREDFIMNNEMLNNNNLNNMGGIPNQGQPTQNSSPTFGGRFFPSLEDEQTNMGLNTGIPSPTANVNENPNNGPAINLSNLNNQAQEPTLNNPQLEPTASILNPMATNMPPQDSISNQLNNIPSLDSLNSTSTPNDNTNQELSIKVDNLQDPNINTQDFNQPVMPNLNQVQETQPIIEPSIPQQPEIPNIINDVTPSTNPIIPNIVTGPIEEPTSTVSPVESPIPEPTLEPNIQTPEPSIEQPTMQEPVMDIPSIQPNIQQEPTIPTINSESSIESTPNEITNSMNEVQPQEEKKDVIPAVNTIKSIVDTLSQLGYNLNISESDMGNNYNITIEIQK